MAKSITSRIVNPFKALYGKVTEFLSAIILLFIIQAILFMASLDVQ